MSNHTTKKLTKRDPQQVLQAAFNDDDQTLSTSSFVDAKIGHKITRTIVDGITDDYRYFDIYDTVNVSQTSGNPQITVDTTEEYAVGDYVFAPGIPANTTIISIDSPTQFTMSTAPTTTVTQDIRIASLLKRIRVIYDTAQHTNVDDTERLD